MDTVECPYCELDVEICHDDGAYYHDEETEEIECEHCEKKFLVRSSISWDFYGEKAECLNDGNHQWKKRFPRHENVDYSRYEECADCGEKRTLPKEETDTRRWDDKAIDEGKIRS